MRRYDSYKDSGVEWIGEIPEGWKLSRLKHISRIRNSSIDRHIYDDELKVNVVHYPDVYKNEKIDSKYHYSRGTCNENEFDKFLLEKDDVIITKDSESPDDIGVPCYISEGLDNVVCGYHLTIISSFKDKAIGAYIFRFLQFTGSRRYFEINANGITRFGLGLSSIYNFSIPLPPLPEQTTIANYLDQKTAIIDQLIQKTRERITKLQELRTATINQAVTKGLDLNVPMKDSGVEWIGEIPEGWDVNKVKYLVSRIIGGGTPSTENAEYWNGNIPWVSPKDMKADRISLTQDYVTYLALKESSTTLIPRNSVLIVVRSGILKHTLPVAINEVEVCLNQDLKALIPMDGISSGFLWYVLKGLGDKILLVCSKMGATVDSIEMEWLVGFKVAIPRQREQESIVIYLNGKLSEIDLLIQKEENRIELLTEYRQSLISEVVTGKICVLDEIPVS